MQAAINDRVVTRLKGLPSAHPRDGQAVVAVNDVPSLAPAETLPTTDVIEIVIIDERVLLRECLAKGIEAAREGISVQCFSTVEEWREPASRRAAPSLVLFCTGSRGVAVVRRELEILAKEAMVPVILVSDEEDPEEIQMAVQLGVRGFIPANVNLHVAVRVMQLVSAGGVYVPPSVLLPPQHQPPRAASPTSGSIQGLFTQRQAAVVDALRQGKPNKIIAYELNMRESTVKVHIRNIMRKLSAKNRTEVAFMITKITSQGQYAG